VLPPEHQDEHHDEQQEAVQPQQQQQQPQLPPQPLPPAALASTRQKLQSNLNNYIYPTMCFSMNVSTVP